MSAPTPRTCDLRGRLASRSGVALRSKAGGMPTATTDRQQTGVGVLSATRTPPWSAPPSSAMTSNDHGTSASPQLCASRSGGPCPLCRRCRYDADEFRVDLGSGGVVDPSRWEGTIMSTMTSVRANGVELGVETFGRDDDPLVLLAGGPTMLSWPDSVCERLAAGGQRVVRYDLRDCGASTTLDPEAPGYHLRDLAADAAALVGTLGAGTAHLGGVGVGGMVAQVAALDHSNAFSALTLVSTRPVAPGPVGDDLPDHDAATMDAVFSRPMPDWTDRAAAAAFAADGAELLGNDPEQARATAARIWD